MFFLQTKTSSGSCFWLHHLQPSQRGSEAPPLTYRVKQSGLRCGPGVGLAHGTTWVFSLTLLPATMGHQPVEEEGKDYIQHFLRL